MRIYYVAGIPYSDDLYHHGIKGQKWGVRRYQNEDGSLTTAGRDRYLVGVQSQVRKAIAERDQSYFGRGGTVNLNKRPVIPSDWLADMGYDAERGGTATVFSHSISIGKNGDHAVSLTPILPNGDVLERDTFEAAMDSVYLGRDGKPHLDGDWGFSLNDIMLSHYDVSNIPEQYRVDYINAMSNGLHEVQEALYQDVNPIDAPTNDIQELKNTKSPSKTVKKGSDFVSKMESTVVSVAKAATKVLEKTFSFIKKMFG